MAEIYGNEEMAKKARRSKIFKKWTSSPSEAAFRGGQASPFHYSQRSHIVQLFTSLFGIFTGHFRLVGQNISKFLGGNSASGKAGRNFRENFLPGMPEALFPSKNFEIFCPSSLKCPVIMSDKIANN